MFKDNRVYELTSYDIEDCYPPEYLDGFNAKKQDIGAKVELAKSVAEKISKPEFESHLGTVKLAIEKCLGLAFGAGDKGLPENTNDTADEPANN